MPKSPKQRRRSSMNGLHGLAAPIEVRRHPCARRLTLRVSRTRRAVIVTMPLQCDEREAGALIGKNLDWVREKLGALPRTVTFEEHDLVPLRGAFHEVAFERSGGSRGLVRRVADGGTPKLVLSGRATEGPRRLRDWLKAEAKRDLEARVRHHAKAIGVRFKRLAVRDQTSRWGSCSSKGSLSFSWRLILAPPFVLDYVAAHEVAHLREMNHGPRFWALVKTMTRRMDEAKDWLRRHGSELYLYCPPGSA